MANFKLHEDKQLFVGSNIVKLKAGDVETTDEKLIAALSKAQGVELLDGKADSDKPPTKAQVAKKLKELGIEFDGKLPVEELVKLLPAL